MQSLYSEADRERVRLTLKDVAGAIRQLIDWNENVSSSDTYYASQGGMQLLAANCIIAGLLIANLWSSWDGV